MPLLVVFCLIICFPFYFYTRDKPVNWLLDSKRSVSMTAQTHNNILVEAKADLQSESLKHLLCGLFAENNS